MAQMETVCPHCNNMLTVENEWIGVNVECPICKQKFVISTVHAQGFTPPENVLKPAGTFHFICPSCNGEADLPATLKGMMYECQFCFDKHVAQESKSVEPPTTPAVQEVVEQEKTFIFVCPECGTVAELPESDKDKEYECKSCFETVVAKEALERPCPHCNGVIKAKATICKHCKASVPPLVPQNKDNGGKNIFSGLFKNNSAAAAPSRPALQPAVQPIRPAYGTTDNVMLSPASGAEKSWVLLTLCNLVFPGVGQIYLGNVKKGIIAGLIFIPITVAVCLISAFVPAAGQFIGRLVFIMAYGAIAGESFATLQFLQMGCPVEKDKWISRKNFPKASTLPPELKKKTMISFCVLIAALLLGLNLIGILTWIILISQL